jgi:hypothetical protein
LRLNFSSLFITKRQEGTDCKGHTTFHDQLDITDRRLSASSESNKENRCSMETTLG